MTKSIRKRTCRPRIIETRCPERVPRPAPFGPPGGGSGGGSDDGGNYEAFDGTYGMAASKIAFISRPAAPPVDPADYAISLIAAGDGTDGKVELRATQGVRIATGPAGVIKGSAKKTEGVEIAVDDSHSITLTRGLMPGMRDERIKMEDGQITVETGAGNILIKSLFGEIKLQVGPSSITLAPAGITIKGIMVNIN